MYKIATFRITACIMGVFGLGFGGPGRGTHATLVDHCRPACPFTCQPCQIVACSCFRCKPRVHVKQLILPAQLHGWHKTFFDCKIEFGVCPSTFFTEASEFSGHLEVAHLWAYEPIFLRVCMKS